MPHLNNKQQQKISLSLAHQRKNKQKLSINHTYTKLTQTTGPTLGGQKPKGRKNSSLGKEDLKDGMGREEGGGFRMGNTCIPVADSF